MAVTLALEKPPVTEAHGDVAEPPAKSGDQPAAGVKSGPTETIWPSGFSQTLRALADHQRASAPTESRE